MNCFTLRIYFIEHTGKKHGTIQAGVECTHTVFIAILYLDPSQYIIPDFTTGFLRLFKGLVAYFFQVQFSLFGTYEGRSHSGMHLFAFLRGKTDGCAYMVGL